MNSRIGGALVMSTSGLIAVAIVACCGLSACESAVSDDGLSVDALVSDGANDGGELTPCEVPQDCVSLASAGGCEVATCEQSTSMCVVLAAPNGTPIKS